MLVLVTSAVVFAVAVGAALGGGGYELGRVVGEKTAVFHFVVAGIAFYIQRRRLEIAPSSPPPRVAQPQSVPVSQHDESSRGKLRFAVHNAELGPAGIEARREDGTDVLVLWRDIVGVVVRRAPPAYHSAVMVDVVSLAGSTLRFVPWTRLSGPANAAAGDDSARTLVATLVERCPDAKLDELTRRFVDRVEPAAQLVDAEMLAMHDSRIG
jgi:hypothetical protein